MKVSKGHWEEAVFSTWRQRLPLCSEWSPSDRMLGRAEREACPIRPARTQRGRVQRSREACIRAAYHLSLLITWHEAPAGSHSASSKSQLCRHGRMREMRALSSSYFLRCVEGRGCRQKHRALQHRQSYGTNMGSVWGGAWGGVDMVCLRAVCVLCVLCVCMLHMYMQCM